jgi:putative SOS response-associated peptidase YedK
MCGRFTQQHPEVTWRRIHEQLSRFLVTPRYNVAPGTDVALLRAGPDGTLPELARWGFRPRWLADASKAQINARSETAAEKPMFRDAWKRGRCAVPADGWYEWRVLARGKQPYYLRRADEAPFLIAGLRTTWSDADGEHATFALLTRAADAAVAAVHSRMPVLLSAEAYEAWLDPAATAAALADLVAAPPPALKLAAVSTRVNSPRNDDAGCIEPVAPVPED